MDGLAPRLHILSAWLSGKVAEWFVYDAQNRLIQTVNPLGQISSTTYTSSGKPASTTDTLGRVTSFFYDKRGNLIQTLYPDGSVTRTTFDDQNRATLSLDRTYVTWVATDPVPDLIAITGTSQGYDSLGRSIHTSRVSNVRTKGVAVGTSGAYDLQVERTLPALTTWRS